MTSCVLLCRRELRRAGVYELENDLFGLTSSGCSEKGSEVFGGVRVDFLLDSDDLLTFANLNSGLQNRFGNS